MTAIPDRFQVLDPTLEELIESYPTKKQAFDRARIESQRRGYPLRVFDLMAQVGKTHLWAVQDWAWTRLETKLQGGAR